MTLLSIISASAALMNQPDILSGRETDALYGETVLLQSDHGHWAEVELQTDGYVAWVEKRHLGLLPKPTHHIITPRALLTQSPDIKSPAMGYIPMGGLIHAEPNQGVLAVYDNNGITGYIPEDHTLPLDIFADDYVSIAERLIGTPYRWGGRDTMGIDCSALVQLSLAATGKKVMRNSSDQEKTIGKTLDDIDQLQRGDLVFWKGHVGIMANDQSLLHANIFHGMTAVEDLKKALPRLENAAGPITRLARI